MSATTTSSDGTSTNISITTTIPTTGSVIEISAASDGWSGQPCAPYQLWPSVDNGVTCGTQCYALVLTQPHRTCNEYCQSFGHVCGIAAEEVDETCMVLQRHTCDYAFTETSDMLCQCMAPDHASSEMLGYIPDIPMAAPYWHCFGNRNAYPGFGVTEYDMIDDDAAALTGVSLDECHDHCTSRYDCGCVTYYTCPTGLFPWEKKCEHGFVDGQCWRRRYCDPAKSKTEDKGFQVCHRNPGRLL
jgi:hypothetical protein